MIKYERGEEVKMRFVIDSSGNKLKVYIVDDLGIDVRVSYRKDLQFPTILSKSVIEK